MMGQTGHCGRGRPCGCGRNGTGSTNGRCSTWLRDNFVPHPGLNAACLCWVLDLRNVQLSDEAIMDINSQFRPRMPIGTACVVVESPLPLTRLDVILANSDFVIDTRNEF